MMHWQPITAITVVTWNGLAYNKQFINSLQYIKFPYKLFIWDNNSTDGTKEFLTTKVQEKYPHATVVYSPENLGMTPAWSRCLEFAFIENQNCKYCLLCNNDISFTSTVNTLIPFMEEYTEMGYVCSNILDSSIPVEKAEEEAQRISSNEILLDELLFPASLISKECFNSCGFFDENLKVAFNDSEYWHRARKAGFGAAVYNGSWIWHKNHASCDLVPKESFKKQFDEDFEYYKKVYAEKGYHG